MVATRRPGRTALVAAAILAPGMLAGVARGQDASWFERQFAAELVTFGPFGEHSRGALYVGDHAMRLEGSEDEVPFVVIYEFAADAVVMRMLEPVSESVMTVRFELDDVVELDVLMMGAITLAPDHPSHPCETLERQASCRFEGDEEVGGTSATRWSITLRDGFGYAETFALWAAADDGRILRTEYPDGYRVDFVGYEFAPQPPGRFVVPQEYEAR